MKFGAKKSKAKTFTRILALFFLVYALSDVSVLQVYCGNEALGIPPDHHMLDSGHRTMRQNESTCSAAPADCDEVPGGSDYDHQHQCFNWQQAGVAYYTFEQTPVVKITAAQPALFLEERHSNSAIFYLFRPPKAT